MRTTPTRQIRGTRIAKMMPTIRPAAAAFADASSSPLHGSKCNHNVKVELVKESDVPKE